MFLLNHLPKVDETKKLVKIVTVALGVICKRKLYLTDNIHLCVLNLTIAFFCQLFVVIPLSLFVLVVHNWVLGSFICYTLPIIQVCFLSAVGFAPRSK